MPLLVTCAVLLLAALGVERFRLERSRSAIPLRVVVTGTRGKTTTARLLASVLREDGRTVLAKTTGSEPCLILPDGSVEPIRRRGPASILEQKALLHRAARLGADAVVAEAMSIHAENHAVEGRRILVPHLVLATNFLVDHAEAQGTTSEEVGAVLGSAVPSGAAVLVPGGACPETFRAAVAAAGATLVEVPAGTAPAPLRGFRENLDLVVSAARRLGVADEAILRGIGHARHDVGALRVWRTSAPRGAEPNAAPERDPAAAPVWLVNAFAANDPASTLLVLDAVAAGLEPMRRRGADAGRVRWVGLLSLRADRGDRTLQWADALAGGLLTRFDALLVTGLHATALERRVRRAAGPQRIRVVRRGSPEELTRAARAELGPGGGVVVGLGNIGGPGLELVDHWSRIGEEADLGH